MLLYYFLTGQVKRIYVTRWFVRKENNKCMFKNVLREIEAEILKTFTLSPKVRRFHNKKRV